VASLGAIGPIESGSGAASLYFISTLDIFAILEKPVVKGGKIVIRKIINGLLDFDHRAMMGNTPIEFLNELKRNLEDPDTYLI
jgi:pyruvate/2-oxoglutarate dehydrogenase complex dihydrolipoamide acyltransferase (E2) component